MGNMSQEQIGRITIDLLEKMSNNIATLARKSSATPAFGAGGEELAAKRQVTIMEKMIDSSGKIDKDWKKALLKGKQGEYQELQRRRAFIEKVLSNKLVAPLYTTFKVFEGHTKDLFSRVRMAWSSLFNRVFGQLMDSFGPFIETAKALISYIKNIGWHIVKSLFRLNPFDKGIDRVTNKLDEIKKTIVDRNVTIKEAFVPLKRDAKGKFLKKDATADTVTMPTNKWFQMKERVEKKWLTYKKRIDDKYEKSKTNGILAYIRKSYIAKSLGKAIGSVKEKVSKSVGAIASGTGSLLSKLLPMFVILGPILKILAIGFMASLGAAIFPSVAKFLSDPETWKSIFGAIADIGSWIWKKTKEGWNLFTEGISKLFSGKSLQDGVDSIFVTIPKAIYDGLKDAFMKSDTAGKITLAITSGLGLFAIGKKLKNMFSGSKLDQSAIRLQKAADSLMKAGASLGGGTGIDDILGKKTRRDKTGKFRKATTLEKAGDAIGGMIDKIPGGKLLKIGGKLIGKIAAPLAIASSLMDLFSGFDDEKAKELFGKSDLISKVYSSLASGLSGLTFGLVDEKTIVDISSKVGTFFTGTVWSSLKSIPELFSSSVSGLLDIFSNAFIWIQDKFKTFTEKISGVGDWISNLFGGKKSLVSPPIPTPSSIAPVSPAPIAPAPIASKPVPTNSAIGTSNMVRTGGSRSWRNFNPGNLRYSEFSKKLGAIGADKNGFAIFPDEETGKKAQRALVFESKNYKNLSLTDAISRYAPSNENDTELYKKRILAIVGGKNVAMSKYTEDERKRIQQAMIKHEGWIPGQMTQTEMASRSPLANNNAANVVAAERQKYIAQTSSGTTKESEVKQPVQINVNNSNVVASNSSNNSGISSVRNIPRNVFDMFDVRVPFLNAT